VAGYKLDKVSFFVIPACPESFFRRMLAPASRRGDPTHFACPHSDGFADENENDKCIQFTDRLCGAAS
jgi:hypothetical protein